MYKLQRTAVGRNSATFAPMQDSGGMSLVFKVNQMGHETEWQHDARPTIGYQIRVGSTHARYWMRQDWIQTSPIVEIVSDEPNRVVFRTKSGSTYIWECGDV